MAPIQFDYGRDLVLAADPGLTRFRRGARACLGAAAAALVLSEIAKWLHKPLREALIGVIIAMTSAIAANDPSPKGQKVTMLILPCLAAAIVTLETAASAWSPQLSDVLFLVVIFLAVFLRRFGPRFLGLGFVAFLTYFFSIFYRPRFEQIPWTAASIFISTAVAFAIRFWLIRDSPERTLDQTLTAFRARLRLVLYQLARLASGTGLMRFRLRRVGKHLKKLNQTALLLEDRVEGHEEWRSAILRLEMAVETFADTVQHLVRAASSEAGPELKRLFDRLRRRVGDRALPDPRRENAHFDRQNGLALHRVRAAADEFVDNLDAVTEAPTGGSKVSDGSSGAGGSSGSMRDSLRLATQATVAGTAALWAGHVLSDVRWYWAMIAAFVVFSRTSTAGETIVRAWKRILGTATGVVAGLITAALVAGKIKIELVLVFACVFGAYYFLQSSYTWTVLFFTTALALLYSLLGKYSPGLLLLRLEETLVGAGAGVLASVLVFPSRSRAKTELAMAETLRAVAELLDEIARAGDFADERRRLEAIRELDRRFQQLSGAAGPLTALPGAAGAMRYKEGVRHLATIVFCARELLREPPGQARDVVQRASGKLAEIVRALAEAIGSKRPVTVDSARSLIEPLYHMDDQSANRAQWLDRIDRALVRLTQSQGISPQTKN